MAINRFDALRFPPKSNRSSQQYCELPEMTQFAPSTTIIVCRSAANVWVLPLRGVRPYSNGAIESSPRKAELRSSEILRTTL